MVAYRTLIQQLLTHQVRGMRARRFGFVFVLQDGLEGVTTIAVVLSFVLRTSMPDVSVHRRNWIGILSRVLSRGEKSGDCQVRSSLAAVTFSLTSGSTKLLHLKEQLRILTGQVIRYRFLKMSPRSSLVGLSLSRSYKIENSI